MVPSGPAEALPSERTKEKLPARTMPVGLSCASPASAAKDKTRKKTRTLLTAPSTPIIVIYKTVYVTCEGAKETRESFSALFPSAFTLCLHRFRWRFRDTDENLQFTFSTAAGNFAHGDGGRD